MSFLASVSYILIKTVFKLVLLLLWLRVALRYFAVAESPISSSIRTYTNPIINFVQKYILQRKWAKGPYDIACLLVIVACEALRFILLDSLFLNNYIPYSQFILYCLVDMIVVPCTILFYAVLIRAIMSWFVTDWRNPAIAILYTVTNPLLQRIHKFLPDTSGLDFSPIVALILLKVTELFALNFVSFPAML